MHPWVSFEHSIRLTLNSSEPFQKSALTQRGASLFGCRKFFLTRLLYFLSKYWEVGAVGQGTGDHMSCVMVWLQQLRECPGWLVTLPCEPSRSPEGRSYRRLQHPSSKHRGSVLPLQNMWIERTIYTTAYKLPGILRWFEVKSVFMVRTPCRKPARHPLLRSDPASSRGLSHPADTTSGLATQNLSPCPQIPQWTCCNHSHL